MSKYGFVGDDGRVFLTRCPKCQRENWAIVVASGQCCWCGYKADKGDMGELDETI